MFKAEAKKWLNMGLSPIPLLAKKKRPAITKWQQYCDELATPEQIEEWGSKYPDANIGLCMGTKVSKDLQIGCVDIDDDALVDVVRRAIGGPLLAKRGHKGQTVLVLASIKDKTSRVRSVDSEGKPSRTPAVEILLHGSQTVLPPSTHPDGDVYHWIGLGATKKKTIESLPLLDYSVMDEIKAICEGKGQIFKDLSEMVWLGIGEGGNTHDVCLSATALMVSRGWQDGEIHRRIERAKLDACAAAGEEYSWPGSTKAIQEWIDSAREKGMADTNKKKIPPERQMADWAMLEFGGKEYVATVYGVLRHYKNGHWPEANEHSLLTSMYDLNPILKEREAKSALSILRTLTTASDFGITPGVDPKHDQKRKRICLINGTINLVSGELESHSQDHELIHQLAFDWDDKAECPMYEKILDFTFNEEAQAIALWDEFCALTLIDDMSFQRMLFLIGPGGNGKGTVASVLRNMHAKGAVGSVGITELNNERKRTSLVGKLVNVSGEQSRLNQVADTYLKKIIGQDPVDVRKLYGETINDVYLSVRFLELVNEMPATSDSTYALGRRLLILECPNKVARPDPDLNSKLVAEYPGILRRWVTALNRLYERGHFDIPLSSELQTDEYLTDNDTVSLWMRDETEHSEKGTSSSELYGHYLEWTRSNGYKHWHPHVQWGKRLKTLGYPVVISKVGHKSLRARRLILKDHGEF